MPDDILKYFSNLLYGFRFKRVKVDTALHIPEGDEDAGNIRLNGNLQVKIGDTWQEVEGAGTSIEIDEVPTSGSDNAVSSGGTFDAIAAEATAREDADDFLNTAIEAEATLRNEADEILSEAIDAGDAAVITTIRDGVTSAGDTLQKLYNLILNSFSEVTVADITARDAYNAKNGDHVFVTNDGDGKWALYKATTAGVNATYIKLSDPDLLNAAMSAAAIKTAYESNPDTNAFTNALLAKLNGLDTSGIAVNAAAIAAEATTRANAVTALQNSINTNTTNIATNSGAISQLQVDGITVSIFKISNYATP